MRKKKGLEEDRRAAARRKENFERRRKAKEDGVPYVSIEEEERLKMELDNSPIQEKEIEHIPLPKLAVNKFGKIELTPEVKKEKRKAPESIFEDTTALTSMKEKLKDVYVNRPDPMSFVGTVSGKYAEEYTKEKVEADIKYQQMARFDIELRNTKYGDALSKNLEMGFQDGEILQAIIIDQINKNNWLPRMKGIMTSDVDDLRVGIDCAFRYEKDMYFGTSFDMTISEEEEVIEDKLRKNWDRYIAQGKIPTLKYFEDPDNHEVRGRRSMPKFIIGGSREDLRSIARAYMDNDFETIANHPLKYAIVAQIDAQLTKIEEFYSTEENLKNIKFAFAREQYTHFREVFEEIKQSVDFNEKVVDGEIDRYIQKNIVYQLSSSYQQDSAASTSLL